jgi:hypothetical protein
MTKPTIILMSIEHFENRILENNGFPIKTYRKMCLGHETNLTRFVLFDMLIQRYITKDDIVVTLKDRKFLYTKIFPNCIDSEAYHQIPNKSDYRIIPLWKITGSEMHIDRPAIYQQFQHTMLEKVDFPEMKLLLNSIEYCPIDPLNQYIDFIVIHHRYQCSPTILQKIIEKVRKGNLLISIIIFTSNITFLKKKIENDTNILWIDNLQLYASYMNSSKCTLVISEWSGGGQLSHYCHDGPVLYYFNHYRDITGYVGREKQILLESMSSDFRGPYWDFKYSRSIDIRLYKNIVDLIENLTF